MKFNKKQLALDISSKMIDRGIGLREAAKEIGISYSTVCRVKQGKEPDVNSLMHLLDWLGNKFEDYILYK